MTIQLTTSATAHIKSTLVKHPGAVGLRLSVKKTGCSGYSYVVDMTEQLGPDDAVFTQDDVSVIVDKKHLHMLNGTQVDFVKDGLNRHFAFHNPNAEHYCGCGESFTLKTSEGDDHGH